MYSLMYPIIVDLLVEHVLYILISMLMIHLYKYSVSISGVHTRLDVEAVAMLLTMFWVGNF